MRNFNYVLLCLTALTAAACSDDDEIDSNEAARRAYLALDGSIAKSINLGFTAFNKASSANIEPEGTTGNAAGTIAVDGQIDQGMSANKGMRLYVALVDYDDGPVPYNDGNDTVHVIFDTSTDMTSQPYLSLMFQNFPNGTLSGTLAPNGTTADAGVYILDGDLEGKLTLNLTIAGPTMAGANAGEVVRVPNMTTVMGTATNSDGGVYMINITI